MLEWTTCFFFYASCCTTESIGATRSSPGRHLRTLFSFAPARSAIGTKRRIDVMQLIGLQDLLYFLRDPWPWGKPHEAAGIHRTSRQRCSRVSACCARPARGQDPAYRHH